MPPDKVGKLTTLQKNTLLNQLSNMIGFEQTGKLKKLTPEDEHKNFMAEYEARLKRNKW